MIGLYIHSSIILHYYFEELFSVTDLTNEELNATQKDSQARIFSIPPGNPLSTMYVNGGTIPQTAYDDTQ